MSLLSKFQFIWLDQYNIIDMIEDKLELPEFQIFVSYIAIQELELRGRNLYN
jgi:hypothetical protein